MKTRKLIGIVAAIVSAATAAQGSIFDTDNPIVGDSPRSFLFPPGTTPSDLGTSLGMEYDYFFEIDLPGFSIPAGDGLAGDNPVANTLVTLAFVSYQTSSPFSAYLINCGSWNDGLTNAPITSFQVGAPAETITGTCFAPGILEPGPPLQTTIQPYLDVFADADQLFPLLNNNSGSVNVTSSPFEFNLYTDFVPPAVPEPSTAGIVLFSCAVLLGIRRFVGSARFIG